MIGEIFNNYVHWILGTRASFHMIRRLDYLVDATEIKTHFSVQPPNGKPVNAKLTGHVKISPDFFLQNVLYILELTCNLIAIGELTTDMKCAVLIFPGFCLVQELVMKKPIGAGELRGGVYYHLGVWHLFQ